MAILDKLLNDTIYLLKFIGSLLLLIFFSIALFVTIQNSGCKNILMCEMQKLLKFLQKFGVHKKPNKTMRELLEESEGKLNISFTKIDRLYHSLRYKKNYTKSELKELQEEIKKIYEESKSLKDS